MSHTPPVIGDHNPERFLFRLFMWPSVSCRLLMTGSHFLMFQKWVLALSLAPCAARQQSASQQRSAIDIAAVCSLFVRVVQSSTGLRRSAANCRRSVTVVSALVRHPHSLFSRCAATGWIVISSRDAMLLHVGSFVAYIVSSLLGGLLQLYLVRCAATQPA